MTKAFIPSESEEQQMLFEWADLYAPAHPELELLFHIPNGAFKTPSMALKFKKEGLKSGVPDLCLPVARHGYHALYIEMKRTTGGKISENQLRWMDRLRQEGNSVQVCFGCEQAIRAIEKYLGIS